MTIQSENQEQPKQDPKTPIATELEHFDSKGDMFARAQKESRELPRVVHETPKSMFDPVKTIDLTPGMQERYEKLGPLGKATIDNLLAYVRAMRPRMPVSDSERLRNQTMLYNTLRALIKNSGNDFRKNMTATLRFFRDFNRPDELTALSDQYVNRDMDNVPLSISGVKQFPLLVELFKSLADPNTRKEYLSVRDSKGGFFNHVLKHDFDDDDIERVKAYFAQ